MHIRKPDRILSGPECNSATRNATCFTLGSFFHAISPALSLSLSPRTALQLKAIRSLPFSGGSSSHSEQCGKLPMQKWTKLRRKIHATKKRKLHHFQERTPGTLPSSQMLMVLTYQSTGGWTFPVSALPEGNGVCWGTRESCFIFLTFILQSVDMEIWTGQSSSNHWTTLVSNGRIHFQIKDYVPTLFRSFSPHEISIL